jgi:hypothetical protein
MVERLQEPHHVVFPEEVLQELRLLPTDRDIPRQVDGEDNGEEKEIVAPRNGRAAGKQPRIRPERHEEQNLRDRSLRQESEARGKRGRGPPAELHSTGADRLEAAEHRHGHAQHEQPIEQEQPRDADESRSNAQQDRGPHRPAFADAAPADEIDRKNRQVDAEGRHDPRYLRAYAEEPVARRDEPVHQRRLVEIRLPLERRHDPVAAREHLAGNLSIPALVGLEEVEAERRIKDRGRKDEQDEKRCNADVGVRIGSTGKQHPRE